MHLGLGLTIGNVALMGDDIGRQLPQNCVIPAKAVKRGINAFDD